MSLVFVQTGRLYTIPPGSLRRREASERFYDIYPCFAKFKFHLQNIIIIIEWSFSRFSLPCLSTVYSVFSRILIGKVIVKRKQMLVASNKTIFKNIFSIGASKHLSVHLFSFPPISSSVFLLFDILFDAMLHELA